VATEPPSIHPTRRLHTPAGEPVEIDLDMVPLIRALWTLDLTTPGCCQDNGQYARARREMVPRREPSRHPYFQPTVDHHSPSGAVPITRISAAPVLRPPGSKQRKNNDPPHVCRSSGMMAGVG
jgi:hypothetical protein